MTGARANRRKWHKFAPNHPLWKGVIERRAQNAPWSDIVTWAASMGYPLTQRQIEYGLKAGGADYPRHVVPWVNEFCLELKEETIPKIDEALAATLVTQAREIQGTTELRNQRLAEYNAVGGDDEMAAAQRQVLMADVVALSGRLFRMLGGYLADLIQVRRVIGEVLPTSLREEEGEVARLGVGLLAISDPEVFRRKAREFQVTIRREFETIIAAVRRGENVPELRPLGPKEAEIAEAEATLMEEDGNA